ncbi:MAG TPA: tRNA (N6-isopentenyl adenosine(37)-C2)-methylthiotransferase MiaB [Nitrospiria bacterium]|jgi:tRNA-2-methylthio-N6-dimethylallyladenosine synthase|nr:tRNA (N6-isopentenyl adenosine(37)-C2)-methylthiotransferase MiaB [Nitrospiria bacterium]
MTAKRLYIKTFGCQMNVHDSERISGLLRNEGYRLTEKPEEADMIIVNTCSIREKSEQKGYSDLGRFAMLKRDKPELILGMAGCVAQQEGEKVLTRFKGLDLVFGSSNISNVPQMVERITLQSQPVVMVQEPPGPPRTTPADRKDRVRAWVSIMEGCDRHCAFCVVPKTRGRERSRPSAEIVQEVRHLAGAGYKEVTLLGQTVNSYGKNLDEGVDFADLLTMLNAVDGIERIRFESPHPCDMTPKLIGAMAGLSKVCEYLHLPLQSGSDGVLEKMGRGYTLDQYRQIIERMRRFVPDMAFSTDIIVGFPGETEDDFQKTLDAVAEFEFDNVFYFNYSRRPNTPAVRFEKQVPKEVQEGRFHRLSILEKGLARKKNQALIGRVQEILIEGRSKRDLAKFTGRTRSNKLVHFDGADDEIGRLLNVRIATAGSTCLEGMRP